MGSVGLKLVEAELPKIKKEYFIDFVVAQAENVSDGRGCTPQDFKRLRKAGVDFCSGGNWTLWRKETLQLLTDPNQPIVRPANYPDGTPGLKYKYSDTSFGRVLIVSLLGKTVGRDSNLKLDNPLKTIDTILELEKDVPKIATLVNFHGDYSSEKVVIGHYLNGRVSAVVGDHWHIPTADARILSEGTVHITDVGMVGTLDSSLGVEVDSIIERWRDEVVNTNVLAEDKPWQFNGLMFEVDPKTGKTLYAKPINLVYG
jgi:metallophosphoesterase (TIGR00282 family)